MATVADLDAGREYFRRQAWGDAFGHLSAAGRESALGPVDLERLAVAAYLSGREADSEDAWAQAFRLLEQRGDARRAARCGFWLAFQLMGADEPARAGGWLARARRLLEGSPPDCVEHGFLLMPSALQALHGGDPETARRGFAEATALGDRFDDRELMALGRLGQGQALIALRSSRAGVALLDEAMTGVAAGEVSPLVAGVVYCAVIGVCYRLLDLGRAREWTAALSRWCEAQPDLVPYRGECLVHRSQIMQLRGSWSEALLEARRACDQLARSTAQAGLGMAYYQRGELHRLLGEFMLAEQDYREANHWGHEPQPGLALLRLAQGHREAAQAAICRAVDEVPDLLTRTQRLPARVEIALATADTAGARQAAGELSALADSLGMAALRAVSGVATGSVLLAEGDPRAALQVLRSAWRRWQELEAPYEGARARVLIGLACRALGDEDGAQMEFDAARQVFSGLGAAPDVSRLTELSGTAGWRCGLTGREVEVLRLVAGGRTNRAIAGELFLSEKTVARHLSNIFTKLGVPSRSAATAYAYQHRLV